MFYDYKVTVPVPVVEHPVRLSVGNIILSRCVLYKLESDYRYNGIILTLTRYCKRCHVWYYVIGISEHVISNDVIVLEWTSLKWCGAGPFWRLRQKTRRRT